MFCFVYVVLLISLERKITSVGLSFKGVILFSKIFYVFDAVYVKSNSISCEFSGLNYVATLPDASEGVFMTGQPKGCSYSSDNGSLFFNVAVRLKF